MKNIILFLALLSAGLSNAQGGRLVLSDAVDYVKGDDAKKANILKAYSVTGSPLTNPFIVVPAAAAGLHATATNAGVADSQSGTGSILAGPAIDALSTVIAKRFKEELTLAFIDSFREKLKVNTYLAGMFPNARLILLNDDPFNHKVWLASFRGALDNDLKALPEHLPVLIEAVKAELSISDATLNALLAAYPSAVNFAKNPEKSYSTVIQLLSDATTVVRTAGNTEAEAMLTLSGLLVKEMGNGNYNDWGLKAKLDQLADFETARTFIGFTIEKYEVQLSAISINEGAGPITLYDYLRALPSAAPATQLTHYVLFANTIFARGVGTVALINDLKTLKMTNSKLEFSDYIPLIDYSVETLEMLTDQTRLRTLRAGLTVPEEIRATISNVKASLSLIGNIKSCIDSKQYAKIVVTTLAFINSKLPDGKKMEDSKVSREFVRYADLAVNLAAAENASEMAAAIENAALPTQSYRLKRHSHFSITLNSYAGVFAGGEMLINTEAKNETAGIAGFTAPVGIGLNWATGKSKTPTKFSKYPGTTKISGKDITERKDYFKGSSFSVFASIVDVGALAAFRLTDDETPTGNIEWGNVIAPGVHLIWGIGNSPLCLGLGVQYGPELRKVTAADGLATPTIDSRAWRAALSLTVDIPLLSLYAKTEKIEKSKEGKKKAEKEKKKEKAEE